MIELMILILVVVGVGMSVLELEGRFLELPPKSTR